MSDSSGLDWSLQQQHRVLPCTPHPRPVAKLASDCLITATNMPQYFSHEGFSARIRTGCCHNSAACACSVCCTAVMRSVFNGRTPRPPYSTSLPRFRFRFCRSQSPNSAPGRPLARRILRPPMGLGQLLRTAVVRCRSIAACCCLCWSNSVSSSLNGKGEADETTRPFIACFVVSVGKACRGRRGTPSVKRTA